MDMLSLCRKRVSDSSDTKRRSPRIAEKSQPSRSKMTASSDDNDKCSANTDSTLPAISLSQNGSIILTILAKPGAKQSAITGDLYKNTLYYLGVL